MPLLYSQHRSRFEARDALERYYALEIVCEAERPYIEHRHGWWRVMFPSTELPGDPA